MRKLLTAILGTALLVAAFGAAPVAATDGDGQANLIECQTERQSLGVKLFDLDNQGGTDKPVFCNNAGANVGYAYGTWALWDSNLEYKNNPEQNNGWWGIWDFGDRANSGRMTVKRNPFSYTRYIRVCYFNNSAGDGYLGTATRSFSYGNDWEDFDFDMTNNNAKSLVIGYRDAPTYSTPPACSDLADIAGWT